MNDITTTEFDFLRKMVREQSAIVLEAGKEYLVESRLLPVLRYEKLGSYSELIKIIRGGGIDGKRLNDAVIDAMTTNETSFFRDNHPWETLKNDILPPLIEARKTQRALTFWCAASSSGQEPYSLAMLLHEHFPDVVANWRIKIMGIDLSPTMVHKAQEGRFSQLEVNRGLPARMMMTYFERAGTEWQIDESCRRMVEISQGNLVDPGMWRTVPPVDGIFIRNVLIYFDDPTRTQILGNAREKLRDDGFLMLGSSENAVGMEGRFKRDQIGRTILFKPLTEAMASA